METPTETFRGFVRDVLFEEAERLGLTTDQAIYDEILLTTGSKGPDTSTFNKVRNGKEPLTPKTEEALLIATGASHDVVAREAIARWSTYLTQEAAKAVQRKSRRQRSV